MNDLPTPNLPLLRKVLDHIDAHPDEWNQHRWIVKSERSSCGTACCIAGWATLLSGGYQPLILNLGDAFEVRDDDGVIHSIANLAESLLGLTTEEADGLFCATNARYDVQRHAETIALRAGEVL